MRARNNIAPARHGARGTTSAQNHTGTYAYTGITAQAENKRGLQVADPRFFTTLATFSAADLADLVGGVLSRDIPGSSVSRVVPLERAETGALSFFEGRAPSPALQAAAGGVVCLQARHASALGGQTVGLIVDEPRVAFARLAARLVEPRSFQSGPAIDPGARLEADVRLAPGVVLGQDAQIGARTRIGPNAVIGPGVAIGRDCRIGANVTILCALIGDRVTVESGAVIGEAGFGVAIGRDAPADVPQLGRVIIQDGVSIGACTAIDRGAFEDTVIGENSKIDNLCHIAHNTMIGRSVIMAGQVGLAGSVRINDSVILAGRVGVADHVEIGAGARLGAGSGHLRSVPAGETWSGYPARPLQRWLRETAWLQRASSAKARNRKKGDEGDE